MAHLTVSQAAARFVELDLRATGARLREKRRALSLTLEDLSEIFERAYCPISVNSIGKWERGVCFPRLDHLYFLACLYGCTLDELVVGMGRARDGSSRDQPVPFAFLRRTRLPCSSFLFFKLSVSVAFPLDQI